MAKLEGIFASRFLRTRKRNRLLSFLSVTSVVGVMLGVATLITVISVMDGFIDNLKQKFLGVNPHIMVTRVSAAPISSWQNIVKDIEQVPHVSGAAPFILSNAIISNGSRAMGVIVRGIDPVAEAKVSSLESTITMGGVSQHSAGSLQENDSFEVTPVTGKLTDLQASALPGILPGKEFMFSLGISVGSEVTVISPTNSRGAFGMVPRMKKFRVVGFVDTGMYEYNRTMVYIALDDAQSFFQMGDGISGIGVMTDNANNAAKISKDIEQTLNTNGKAYWARDWLSMNESLFSALTLERYALFVVLTMITIVASFNIVSMITVTVKDKKKEIAILRAMGAEEKFIERIFVRQGLFIGALGTLLGNALALGIALLLKNFHIINIPKEIYYSDTVPVKLSLEVYVVVTVCALLITYIAAKIPSRMSAKIDPIEAIRND